MKKQNDRSFRLKKDKRTYFKKSHSHHRKSYDYINSTLSPSSPYNSNHHVETKRPYTARPPSRQSPSLAFRPSSSLSSSSTKSSSHSSNTKLSIGGIQLLKSLDNNNDKHNNLGNMMETKLNQVYYEKSRPSTAHTQPSIRKVLKQQQLDQHASSGIHQVMEENEELLKAMNNLKNKNETIAVEALKERIHQQDMEEVAKRYENKYLDLKNRLYHANINIRQLQKQLKHSQETHKELSVHHNNHLSTFAQTEQELKDYQRNLEALSKKHETLRFEAKTEHDNHEATLSRLYRTR